MRSEVEVVADRQRRMLTELLLRVDVLTFGQCCALGRGEVVVDLAEKLRLK